VNFGKITSSQPLSDGAHTHKKWEKSSHRIFLNENDDDEEIFLSLLNMKREEETAKKEKKRARSMRSRGENLLIISDED
jgi:hypothetical protein